MFVFCFSMFDSYFVYLCSCTVLRIVSTFVYSCLFPIFVQVYRPLPQGGNPIAVNKYHIISYHITYKTEKQCIRGINVASSLETSYVGTANEREKANGKYESTTDSTGIISSCTEPHQIIRFSKYRILVTMNDIHTATSLWRTAGWLLLISIVLMFTLQNVPKTTLALRPVNESDARIWQTSLPPWVNICSLG